MKKNISFIIAMFPIVILAQFDPPAGQNGSKAIHKDDAVFVNWATDAVVNRGPQDIAVPNSPLATVGTDSNAKGKADNSVVSLGDGGSAVLTFQKPITNGTGADFAVFENSFSDTFLELAFVEASSDGINYFRFPATSNTPTDAQVGSFGAIDATKINNLAGKYRALYGTTFDINELPDSPLLNKNKITHIKVIDVIGTINPSYATYDSAGNIVNDPYPTAFGSGGFDLDAVGVINQLETTLSTQNVEVNRISIYPNPASDYILIKNIKNNTTIHIFDGTGKLVKTSLIKENEKINISSLPKGIYYVQFYNGQNKEIIKIMKF